MVNQFAYCPRLFHLEWVQKLWSDNAFTRDGDWQHRRVDEASRSGRQRATTGDEEPVPFERTTSVDLSSAALGLVAKADVVETAASCAVPVEIKRGSPATTGHPVRFPDRAQLTVIALLLRESGLECTEGAVWFAETRQRVRVEFDDELIAEVLALLDDLNVVARSATPPPPTEDVRKCDGCSLAGICLPDEVSFLSKKRVQAPRQLLARDSAARPLYVTEPGAYVGKSSGRITISKKEESLGDVRLIDVSQLCVYGNVQVSTQLVRELMSREVPVMWFSGGGWFQGITEGLPGKNIELRRRQFAATPELQLSIARSMIGGKIRNSRTVLRRNGRPQEKQALSDLRRLAVRAEAAENVASLLGFEGAAARTYFSGLNSMLRGGEGLPGDPFVYAGRNRRPPTDPINCLLSYAYSLLAKDCVATLRSIGFDPYLGFLHQPRFGRPALALDLAEEFRPVIADSVVLTAANNGEIKPNHFFVRNGGVSLTADGRRAFLATYERRLDTEITHPIFGYKATWRRVIEIQARLLAAYLFDEIDAYHPILVR